MFLQISRSKVYPTPPTPVQSFFDLSSSSTDLIESTASHRSFHTEHTLDSASKTSITSTDSSTTELKQSQSSPKLSKRSRSAGAGKRVLSGGSARSQDGGRIVSAEERKGRTRNRDKPPTDVANPSERRSSRTSKQSSRKSSVSNVELPVWDSEILPLLKRLDTTSYESTTELCETCDLIWSSLSTHSLLGRTGGLGGTKRRGNVLRTVFRLLDHKNPHVLLKVSRIILAVSSFYIRYNDNHVKFSSDESDLKKLAERVQTFVCNCQKRQK